MYILILSKSKIYYSFMEVAFKEACISKPSSMNKNIRGSIRNKKNYISKN